jgi:predicted transcriptional regulator
MSNHSQNSKIAFRMLDLPKKQLEVYNYLELNDFPRTAKFIAGELNVTEHSITGRLLELRKKGLVIIDNSAVYRVQDRNYYRIRTHTDPIEVFKPTPSERIKELEIEVKRLKDKYEPLSKENLKQIDEWVKPKFNKD